MTHIEADIYPFVAVITPKPRGIEYAFFADGQLIADAAVKISGTGAELHHSVYKPSAGAIKSLRRYFHRCILPALGERGIRNLIVSMEGLDMKMLRYWRLMGFNIFTGLIRLEE